MSATNPVTLSAVQNVWFGELKNRWGWLLVRWVGQATAGTGSAKATA